MLEERVVNLINAELDGELSASECAELESVLEQSAEARAMKAELQMLDKLLSRVPEQVPPADLNRRLRSQVRLREGAPRFFLAGLFASFRPVQSGLAFAAGLLLAVGIYEFSSDNSTASDTYQMVGTMVAGKLPADAVTVDSLTVRKNGINGTVSLRKKGALTILDFDLDSDHPAEIEVSYAGAGLNFGGIARTSNRSIAPFQYYAMAGQGIRVVHQGRQAFSIFLHNGDGIQAGGHGINIEISSDGKKRFSGVLHS